MPYNTFDDFFPSKFQSNADCSVLIDQVVNIEETKRKVYNVFNSSIVSSVDFDKSFEHFAMAGVTKRIKVFDFANILERPYGVHYTSLEMTHNAKLSCVSWNRYFRQQLVCSDYEGFVTLWDAEAGPLIRSHQRKRVLGRSVL
jgi:hypothetical protein